MKVKNMKKTIKNILILLILAISTTCLFACGDDGDSYILSLNNTGEVKTGYLDNDEKESTFVSVSIDVLNSSETNELVLYATDFTLTKNGETITAKKIILGYNSHSKTIGGVQTSTITYTTGDSKTYAHSSGDEAFRVMFDLTDINGITNVYYKGKEIKSK
jgi:hypothetical protein